MGPVWDLPSTFQLACGFCLERWLADICGVCGTTVCSPLEKGLFSWTLARIRAGILLSVDWFVPSAPPISLRFLPSRPGSGSLGYGLPPPVEPGGFPFRTRSISLWKGNFRRVRSRLDRTWVEPSTCDRTTNRSDRICAPSSLQVRRTCAALVGSNEASEGGGRGGAGDVGKTRATERRHDVDGGVLWSIRRTTTPGPCPSDVGRHRTHTHPENHLQTQEEKERIASIRRVPGKQKPILVVSSTFQLHSSAKR